MSDVYVIEVDDLAVGLVARQRGDHGYRFHAALTAVFALDGSSFPSPAHAQRAARKALGRLSKPERAAKRLGVAGSS